MDKYRKFIEIKGKPIIYYTIKNSITLSCNINNIFNNHYFSSATKLAKPRNFIATIAYNF